MFGKFLGASLELTDEAFVVGEVVEACLRDCAEHFHWIMGAGFP